MEFKWGIQKKFKRTQAMFEILFFKKYTEFKGVGWGLGYKKKS